MPYRLRVLNVESTIGIRFKRPIALNDLLEKRFPNKAVEVLSEFGIDSNGFNLEQRDRLFDYRLSFHLFGGNAQFEMDARELTLSFQQVHRLDSFDVIAHCLRICFEDLFASLEGLFEHETLSIAFSGYAQFESPESYLAHAKQFAFSDASVVSGGLIANHALECWPETCRIVIEQFEPANQVLLIAISTHTQERFSKALLSSLKEACAQITLSHNIVLIFSESTTSLEGAD